MQIFEQKQETKNNCFVEDSPSDEPQPSTSAHLLSSCENSGSGHEIANTDFASPSSHQRVNGTLPGYNNMRTSMIVTPDQGKIVTLQFPNTLCIYFLHSSVFERRF